MAQWLTYQQALTLVIAVVAIVLSFVSLRRTSRVQGQQLRLQRKQEELTDLQLEALRRQAEAQAGSATPPIVQEKADVRVDLEKMGRDYKFLITNWGRASARDVTFDLDLEVGARSPLIGADYNMKIPIPELAPGSRVPLFAAITLDMKPAFPARWSWLNPDNSRESRKTLLAL